MMGLGRWEVGVGGGRQGLGGRGQGVGGGGCIEGPGGRAPASSCPGTEDLLPAPSRHPPPRHGPSTSPDEINYLIATVS